MDLRTAAYDYLLPDDLIARYPAKNRDDSRLMLLERKSGQITDLKFGDFPNLMQPDELLVLNDTKVIPARIRLPGRKAEILLLSQIDDVTWRCLVRPGKWFSVGRTFTVKELEGKVAEIFPNGDRLIRFEREIDFKHFGELPLPPYLARDAEASDQDRYQTVYAAREGAVAAPTAGLHFTSEMLKQLPHEFITLHVGVGTFKPVTTVLFRDHQMHLEEFEVQPPAAARIDKAAHVLAVGTTTVRTLETLMQREGRITAGRAGTDIFIYPPFEFRRVNSLLTNFHLPKSTLLMLVAAFAGKELVMEAYRQAVVNRYRFFSYGDCMLIR